MRRLVTTTLLLLASSVAPAFDPPDELGLGLGRQTTPPPAVLDGDVCVAAAACAWSGEQALEYLGWSVDAGGDFDGDGRQDIIVGAPGFDVRADGGGIEDAGRALLLSGATFESAGSDAAGGNDSTAAQVVGASVGDQAGSAVTFLGDVDGDGTDDLMVGMRGADEGGVHAGVAVLIRGSPAGWSDAPAAAARFVGESPFARLGTALDGAGDVDGDGLADILLSGELKALDGKEEVFAEGRVYLLFGRADGWPASLADAGAVRVLWSR